MNFTVQRMNRPGRQSQALSLECSAIELYGTARCWSGQKKYVYFRAFPGKQEMSDRFNHEIELAREDSTPRLSGLQTVELLEDQEVVNWLRDSVLPYWSKDAVNWLINDTAEVLTIETFAAVIESAIDRTQKSLFQTPAERQQAIADSFCQNYDHTQWGIF